MENKCYNVLLLGEAGSGKSTFINYLTNYFYGKIDFDNIIKNPDSVKLAIPVKNWEKNVMNEYKKQSTESDINNATRSQTSACTSYTFEQNSVKCIYIDTPGFNDTAGTKLDYFNIQQITEACQAIKTLNSIILIINGTNARLNTGMRSVLETLKSFMPISITGNIIVVLTNCDENSCNFDYKKLLNGIVKYKSESVYWMQNNLFKWNKKSQSKARNDILKSHFMDSISTLEDILKDIRNMESVSCESFEFSKQANLNTQKLVNEQIKVIIEILRQINDFEMKKRTIKSAYETMAKNKKHETTHIIDVFPLGKGQPKKFEMKLDNNAAKHQYYHAQKQLEQAKKDTEAIENSIKALNSKIDKTFNEIKVNVAKIRNEFKDFNFLNDNYESIEKIRSIVGEKSLYYLKIIELFSNTNSINELNTAENQKHYQSNVAQLTNSVFKNKTKTNGKKYVLVGDKGKTLVIENIDKLSKNVKKSIFGIRDDIIEYEFDDGESKFCITDTKIIYEEIDTTEIDYILKDLLFYLLLKRTRFSGIIVYGHYSKSKNIYNLVIDKLINLLKVPFTNIGIIRMDVEELDTSNSNMFFNLVNKTFTKNSSNDKDTVFAKFINEDVLGQMFEFEFQEIEFKTEFSIDLIKFIKNCLSVDIKYLLQCMSSNQSKTNISNELNQQLEIEIRNEKCVKVLNEINNQLEYLIKKDCSKTFKEILDELKRIKKCMCLASYIKEFKRLDEFE